MPANVFDFAHALSPYRRKHYGWAGPEDRLAKFRRYMALDPEGIRGSLPQSPSIRDPNPNLVERAESWD